MSYGVFQEYYSSNWTLQGSQELTGVIGTTTNGVMYLSMPLLFALFTRRWAHLRQTAALCGAALTCISFLISSFSTDVWHLIATQGVMAALGCALVYSPIMQEYCRIYLPLSHQSTSRPLQLSSHLTSLGSYHGWKQSTCHLPCADTPIHRCWPRPIAFHSLDISAT